MGFFKGLGKAIGTVAKVAAPVVLIVVSPEAIVNTVAGSVVKHGVKVIGNGAIPYLNLGISTAVAYGRHVAAGEDLGAAVMPALTEGGALAAVSTMLHQSLKLPLRDAVRTPGIAAKVGPGSRFSL